MQEIQQTLPQENIEAFYHDYFIEGQINDFIKLLNPTIKKTPGKVIDIGGGCGFFAKELQNRTNLEVKVLDTDLKSLEKCKRLNVEAIHDDALNPTIVGNESIVCFNLILHHLVGNSEDKTRKLQMRALSVWHSKVPSIFVNEYIYESYISDGLSGRLIFQITKSSILSKLANLIAKVIPSLKANTFGVGVRFRSHKEWGEIFESLGFKVVNISIGEQEKISLARRILFIKNCRRDSFLLQSISK